MVRTSFMAMVGAARAAGAGIKAALVSTGIGAVIVGIGMAIEAVMAKIGAANEAARALRREGGDTSRAINANAAAQLNVGNTDEQADLLENLDEQIASVRERLGNVSEEYDSDEAIAAASEQLERHIALLEAQKRGVSNISPEYMAQVTAIRAQEAALAAAKQRAEELGKEVERASAAYDKAAEQRALDAMAPDDAEKFLIGQAGHRIDDLESLRAYIEKQKEKKDLMQGDQERLLQLLALEEKLVSVQARQTQEREKAAEQAARLADMQRGMVLDAEKTVAEAMGDKAAVRAIEIEQKTRQIASQLEGQGMDPNEASDVARKKAEMAQLASEINNAANSAQIARGDAQKSIGLGGSAGIGPNIDAQREMAKKQDTANTLLADIKSLMGKHTPVMLAEVFD
jgi:hypothetical protein